MEKLLPQDQTSEGICYAYSAVDLIEAYRNSHAPQGIDQDAGRQDSGPPLSPFLLAIDRELDEASDLRSEIKYQQVLAKNILKEIKDTKAKIGWAEDAAKLCRDVISGQFEYGKKDVESFRQSLQEEEDRIAQHKEDLERLGKNSKEIIDWIQELRKRLERPILMRGGNVSRAIDHAIEKGACPQSHMGPNLLALTGRSFQNTLARCHNKCARAKLKKILFDKTDEDLTLAFNSIETSHALAAQGCLAARGVSAPILPSLTGTWEAISAASPDEFMEALLSEVSQNCRQLGVVRPAVPKPTVTEIRTTQDLAKVSKAAFDDRHVPDSKKQPFSIAYCWKALVRGETSYTDCEGKFHSSTAIGRRWNAKTGRCQLLLQNHWGRKCDGMPEDWDCQGGKTWIDLEALGTISTTSTFLKP